MRRINSIFASLFLFSFIISACSLDHTNPADPKTIIPPPSNLKAFVKTFDRIKLKWAFEPDYDCGFLIERKTSPNDFSELVFLETKVFEYIDTAVTENITYTYRIKTITLYNESDYSAEISCVLTDTLAKQ
jgi:hypothetical protein